MYIDSILPIPIYIQYVCVHGGHSYAHSVERKEKTKERSRDRGRKRSRERDRNRSKERDRDQEKSRDKRDGERLNVQQKYKFLV